MNPATKRKQGQLQTAGCAGHQAGGGGALERERQQLDHLRIVRAGSGEPYSADEFISTLIRARLGTLVGAGGHAQERVCSELRQPTGLCKVAAVLSMGSRPAG